MEVSLHPSEKDLLKAHASPEDIKMAAMPTPIATRSDHCNLLMCWAVYYDHWEYLDSFTLQPPHHGQIDLGSK